MPSIRRVVEIKKATIELVTPGVPHKILIKELELSSHMRSGQELIDGGNSTFMLSLIIVFNRLESFNSNKRH